MLLRLNNRLVCLLNNNRLICDNVKVLMKCQERNFLKLVLPTVRQLHTTGSRLNETPEKSNSDSPAPPPRKPEATGKRFVWENRTRTATAMMVLWAVGVGSYMYYQHTLKEEKYHRMMLEQSLQLMSDSEREEVEAMLKDSALSKSGKTSDKKE